MWSTLDIATFRTSNLPPNGVPRLWPVVKVLLLTLPSAFCSGFPPQHWPAGLAGKRLGDCQPNDSALTAPRPPHIVPSRGGVARRVLFAAAAGLQIPAGVAQPLSQSSLVAAAHSAVFGACGRISRTWSMTSLYQPFLIGWMPRTVPVLALWSPLRRVQLALRLSVRALPNSQQAHRAASSRPFWMRFAADRMSAPLTDLRANAKVACHGSRSWPAPGCCSCQPPRSPCFVGGADCMFSLPGPTPRLSKACVKFSLPLWSVVLQTWVTVHLGGSAARGES